MVDIKILSAIISNGLEKLTLVMCEFAFGSIVIDGVITKDIPLDRELTIVIGFAIFVACFVIYTFVAYLNETRRLLQHFILWVCSFYLLLRSIMDNHRRKEHLGMA